MARRNRRDREGDEDDDEVTPEYIEEVELKAVV